MASIQTGAVVNDIRGKIGSQVYLKGKSGPFVREHVNPVQPNTTIQIEARADMATAIAAWQALTDEVRQQWNVLADSLWSANRIGVLRKVSGFSLFVERKITALVGNNDNNPVPRNDTMSVNFDFSIVELSTSLIRLQALPNVDSALLAVRWFASPAVSPGRMSANSQRYTLLRGQFLTGSGLSLNLLTLWEARFGAIAPHVGKKVFFKAKVLQVLFDGSGPESGRVAGIYMGTPIVKYAVVTA